MNLLTKSRLTRPKPGPNKIGSDLLCYPHLPISATVQKSHRRRSLRQPSLFKPDRRERILALPGACGSWLQELARSSSRREEEKEESNRRLPWTTTLWTSRWKTRSSASLSPPPKGAPRSQTLSPLVLSSPLSLMHVFSFVL